VNLTQELPMNRRNFLKSLSRTALVLPFSEVLMMAAPPWRRNAAEQTSGGMTRSYDATPVPPPPGPASPIAATPLGVNFVDVASNAGLSAKTI
jgi:enediyne biosynthesis protein E4